MKYKRGRAGPISRMTIEIGSVVNIGREPNSRARGDGIATLSGSGRVTGVDFLVQGRNHAAIRDLLVPGGTVDVDVRWTSATAVTILRSHRAQAMAA